MKFKKFKFKKVRSTNNTAIRIIKKTHYKYGMVISESQTNGKGQYGRKWISLKGNLFVTFFYEVNKINVSSKKRKVLWIVFDEFDPQLAFKDEKFLENYHKKIKDFAKMSKIEKKIGKNPSKNNNLYLAMV